MSRCCLTIARMRATLTPISAPLGTYVPRYLVVAHQTAVSDELLRCLREQAAASPDASFVLLVPATPVQDLLGWEDLTGQNQQDSQSISARRAEEALQR